MINKGLIAWYKLNGNFNDSSGNSYHAQERKRGECNDISFEVSEFGTCAVFDGKSSSVGNYIETPFKLQEDKLTVSMWVNKPACSWNVATCSTGGSNEILFFLNTSNLLTLFSYVSVASCSSVFTNNTWHHVVFTMSKLSPTTGSFNIYIDGELKASQVREARVNDSLYSNNFVLGMDWDSSTATDFYKGLMRDVRIYNRELSLDEIKVIYGGLDGLEEYTASIEVKSNTGEEIEFNMIIDDMCYSNKEPVYSYGRYHNLCDDFNLDEITGISEDLGVLEIDDNSLTSNRALNLRAAYGSSSSFSCLVPISNLIPNKLHTISFKYKFIYQQRGFILSVTEDGTILQSVSKNKDDITHYRTSSFVFTPSDTTAHIKIEIPADAGQNAFDILFGDFQINVGEEVQQYSSPNNKGGVLIQENTINYIPKVGWSTSGLKDPDDIPNTAPVEVFMSSKVNAGDWQKLFTITSDIVLQPNERVSMSAWVYCKKNDGAFNLQCDYTIDGSDRVYNSGRGIKFVSKGWHYLTWSLPNESSGVDMTLHHARLEAYYPPGWTDGDNEAWGVNYTIEKKKYPTACESSLSNRDRQITSYPLPYKLSPEAFSVYGFFRAGIDSDIMNTDGYYYTMVSLFNNLDSTKHLRVTYRPGGSLIRLAIGNNNSSHALVNINNFSFNRGDTIFYCASLTATGINFYAGIVGDTLLSASTSMAEVNLSGITHLNLGMAFDELRQNNGYNSHIHLLNRNISLDEATYLFNSNHKPESDEGTVMYLDFNGDAHEYKHRKLLHNGYTETGFNKIEGVVVPTKGAINYDFEVINKGVGDIEKRHLQFEKGSTSTSYTSFGRSKPSLAYPISVLNKECGTISFWIKLLDEFTEINPIFTNGQTEGLNAFDLLYGRNASMPEGRLYYRKYNEGVSSQIFYDLPEPIYNKWTHIALTYENRGHGKLYINGELVRTSTLTMDMTNMGDFFAIGSHIRTPMNFKMDELKIDNVVRSDSEILTYYNTIYPFYPRGEEYTIM